MVAAAAEVPHGALQSPGWLAAHLGRGDSGCSQNVGIRQETLQYAADVEVYCCWRDIFRLQASNGPPGHPYICNHAASHVACNDNDKGTAGPEA